MKWDRSQGLKVDLDEIRSVAFSCRPAICRRGLTCCTSYEVRVSGEAVKRITGLMPQIVRHKPALKEVDGFANPFERGEGGEWVLDEDEDGRCALAYCAKDGSVWCGVHSAALDAGVDPWVWKPMECLLWPLALSEDPVPVLGIQEDAAEFPCIKKRSRRAKGLDEGIAEIVRRLFGQGVEREILQGLETGSSTWNITAAPE